MSDKKAVILVEMSWPAYHALTPTKRKWLGNMEHRLRVTVAKIERAAFNAKRLKVRTKLPKAGELRDIAILGGEPSL